MTVELDPETRAWLRAAVSSEPRMSVKQRERSRLAVLAKGVASASLPAASAAVTTSATAAVKTGSLSTVSVKALAVWLASGAGLGAATVGAAELVQRARARSSMALAAGTSAPTRSQQRSSDEKRAGSEIAERRLPDEAAADPTPLRSTAGPNEPSPLPSSEPSVRSSPARVLSPLDAPPPVGALAPEPTRVLDLSAELALMNELQAALRDGSGSRAEALIARHAREFPEGQFRLERVAATVFAACQRGDRALAARAAQAFLAEDTSSALAARVRASCADFPESNP